MTKKSGPEVDIQCRQEQGGRLYQEDRVLFGTTTSLPHGADKALKTAFKKTEAATRHMKPGSTTTAAVITPNHVLHLYHVGNSPAFLFTHDPQIGEVISKRLNSDHIPTDPSERQRIEDASGVVFRGRVDGVLNISRAFGDAAICGVSQKPDKNVFALDAEINSGTEVYLLLASDGLTEGGLTKEEMAQIIRYAIDHDKVSEIPERLVASALQSGSSDNVSVLFAQIPKNMTKSIAMVIADGHGGHETADVVIDEFRSVLMPPKETPKVRPPEMTSY